MDKLKRINMIQQGIRSGEIRGIGGEVYTPLENKMFSGLPAKMYLKHLTPLKPPGLCYERSFVVAMALPECKLMRANQNDIDSRHGWAEIDGWCYDTSHMGKFKKELYYDIFEPSEIVSHTYDEQKEWSFYKLALTFHSDPDLRSEYIKFLAKQIPQIEARAQNENEPEFITEIENFKQKISREIFHEKSLDF